MDPVTEAINIEEQLVKLPERMLCAQRWSQSDSSKATMQEVVCLAGENPQLIFPGKSTRIERSKGARS